MICLELEKILWFLQKIKPIDLHQSANAYRKSSVSSTTRRNDALWGLRGVQEESGVDGVLPTELGQSVTSGWGALRE